jgi:hypothetical protein
MLAINSGPAHIDPVSDGGVKEPSGAAEPGQNGKIRVATLHFMPNLL